MSVKSIGTYDFPAVDPPENFGGHLVFFGYNEGNRYFASPFTFRAPAETPWVAFRSEMLDPILGADPDLDIAAVGNWRVDDKPITPSDGDTLASLGIGFRSLLRFNA